jgi:hypothetical protein
MARIFRYKNFGVYVLPEGGERHSLPHVHIKERGRPVCTVNLITLRPLQKGVNLPAELVSQLEERVDEMADLWNELNP